MSLRDSNASAECGTMAGMTKSKRAPKPKKDQELLRMMGQIKADLEIVKRDIAKVGLRLDVLEGELGIEYEEETDTSSLIPSGPEQDIFGDGTVLFTPLVARDGNGA